MRSDAERLMERIRAWRASPVTFVGQVFNAEPSDQQTQLLDAIAPDDARVAVRSGIATGKTTADAWATWWHVICWPGKVAVTAPTAAQLQDALVAECALWRSRMHPALQAQTDIGAKRAILRDSLGATANFATFRTSSKHRPEALQGLHAAHVMAIVDEASGVDEAVFEPLRGATGTLSTRVLFTSNPTRATGYFHRIHTQDAYAEQWTRLVFDSRKSPHADPKELAAILREYGADSDMYRVRVLGEFPAGSPCQLISTDLVLAARARHYSIEEYHKAPVILGVDVAWEGNDRSAVYMRQGLFAQKLGVFHKLDNMSLAEYVLRWWDEYEADAVFIDVGWGTGVIDRLRQLGRNPIPVSFGGTKGIDPRFVNKRTEMWVRMKDWLEAGGVVPSHDELLQDLTAPEYYPAGDIGKLQLERKVDTKRRTRRSPDEGDALALTFAMPVKPTARELQTFSRRAATTTGASSLKNPRSRTKSGYKVL